MPVARIPRPGVKPLRNTATSTWPLKKPYRPRRRVSGPAPATPMQFDAVEAADLLALTRRVGAFQYDPRLMQVYYETLSGLTSNRPLRTSEWAFLRRAVLAVEA